MNFASDNVTGISPEIMAALTEANQGAAMPYGNDDLTRTLESRFCDLFETQVEVFPVATGSAANALALAVMAPPFGAIYCHAESHINVDECGAPEFYTGGAKLVLLEGDQGKMQPEALAIALNQGGAGVVHHVQPAAVSLTQATEAGTVYALEEVGAIAQIAHAQGLHLHMDGARFANAIISLGCSPAEMTWKAGVDMLSFGATKNGAMAAEAIIVFNPNLSRELSYRRKRGGHLFSKMRFLSAQLLAYITDDLWLRNAAHANRMAAKLAMGLQALPQAHLLYPVQANELFVALPEEVIQGLLNDGFQFYRWPGDEAVLIRLVTAFNTSEEDVDALLRSAQRHTSPIAV